MIEILKKFLKDNDLVIASECDDDSCEYGGHLHEPGEGHDIASKVVDWEAEFKKIVTVKINPDVLRSQMQALSNASLHEEHLRSCELLDDLHKLLCRLDKTLRAEGFIVLEKK